MIQDRPRLSICIPAFNRGAFIGETLESVASQMRPDVEIVISDNASTDDTADVVEHWRGRLPRLTYWRSRENQGFSRNFMQAVELATGDYAWLLGSDDLVRPAMLGRLLTLLGEGHTAYVFDRMEWNPRSGAQWLDPVLLPTERQEVFTLNSSSGLEQYLRSGRSITAMFAFISSVVFDRSAWEATPMRDAWHDCAFPHAMRLFAVLAAGGTLRYVREPLVLNRLGNDTFNPGGRETIRRLLMDYDGYDRIIVEHWRDAPRVASAAKSVMRRTHPAIDVLKFRRIVRPDQVAAMRASLRDFDYSPLLVWFYGIRASRSIVAALKAISRVAPRRVVGGD